MWVLRSWCPLSATVLRLGLVGDSTRCTPVPRPPLACLGSDPCPPLCPPGALTRVPRSARSRVMTFREHTAWVVKACLQKHPEGHIVSVR